MKIPEKLKKIRTEMEREGVDVYLIPTADYHLSEYVGEYFQTRKFMSGFTGSAGTLVITKKEAVLFTDGRYFAQAESELCGSGIGLMRIGMEGVPELKEYIDSKMDSGKYLGFDGRMISMKDGSEYESKYKIRSDIDLTDRIWENRPPLACTKAWILEERYAGEAASSKLNRLREKMKQEDAQYHLIASLDDIAWLFNIRGNDVENNPVILSYALVGMEDAVLFANPEKFDSRMREYFSQNKITLKPYEEVYSYLGKILQNKNILLDNRRTNYSLYRCAAENCKCVFRENPTVLMKAVKNETEIENERNAHIKDGVAVTKFIYWLKKNIGQTQITEFTAAEKLEEFRRMQEGYLEPSFETISAYNANAAMMHYSPHKKESAVLKQEGILLVDSGGQYYEGTTDVTRTIRLGEVCDELKKHYTAVVRGMLNLANAKFLHGCIGQNLDILARGPVWELGIDYRCGTGHGVGYLLNVHEAPNGFRWKRVPGREEPCVLEAGMITSDEPGIYLEGKYGIRIENEIVVREAEKNEYGQFLSFETLTVVPIDLELIDFSYMNQEDKKRLEQYEKFVYEKIGKYLDLEEKQWFQKNFLTELL